jgi:predicted Fe-Mo cluster-binding NifX family protein
MIIAVTASAEGMDCDVDPRFGRAAFFVIFDTEKGLVKSIVNDTVSASGGAGISAAKTVIDAGAQAVITGNCGPNAARTLQAAGIKIFANANGTVAQAVEDYKAGKLDAIQGPTVDSHFGTTG